MVINMKIIRDTTEFHIDGPTAVAIGKFDGLHRGHQKLLRTIQEQKERGLQTVVFTFVPSPAAFFSKELVQELTTVAEKRLIFENAGIDYLIEYPFCQETANMSPEDYIQKVLVEQLQAKCIVAGYDISYGKRGAGDCKLLEQLAPMYGYEVIIIEKVQYEGREVSSTYVREEVKQGNMRVVYELLGTPYHVGGTIVHGKKLGRTIGMPTVNLLPPKEKLLPPNGVYYSKIVIKGEIYFGITNIGTKPTVSGEPVIGVETYIYDFEDVVYGEDAEVYLLEYKRPEMRFSGVDELKEKMQADILSGRIYHGLDVE